MKKLTSYGMLFVFLFIPLVSYSVNGAEFKCEVLEVGGLADNVKGDWGDLHYLVIHQAHSEDRVGLSKKLKLFNGQKVEITAGGKTLKAVIFRLSHCFGRGFLLYKGHITVNKKDVISVKFQ